MNILSFIQKTFLRLVMLVSLIIATPACLLAQLTEQKISADKWNIYGQVKFIGVAKASLEYKVNATDSTFILQLEDERKELKSFFSIRFNSMANTVAWFRVQVAMNRGIGECSRLKPLQTEHRSPECARHVDPIAGTSSGSQYSAAGSHPADHRNVNEDASR